MRKFANQQSNYKRKSEKSPLGFAYKRESFVSEKRVDLSFSTSMRVNERRKSSRKLLNELGGRFFIIR